MKTLQLLFVIGVTIFSSLGTCRGSAGEIPLPDDIEISVPDPTLPEEIKKLSGKWSGTWNPVITARAVLPLPCILVVEKILSPKEVQVVYSIAETEQMKGEWRRFNAQIFQKGKRTFISFASARDAKRTFEFRLSGETLVGELKTSSAWGDQIFSIVMKKIQ